MVGRCALCGNMILVLLERLHALLLDYNAGYVVIKLNENNDTRFLYYMLDTMNLGQYSDQSAQPGTSGK